MLTYVDLQGQGCLVRSVQKLSFALTSLELESVGQRIVL